MTADERIEKILNRFGQTISDLPKADNKKYSYGWYTMQHLDKAARNYGKKDAYFDWAVVADYACHLCDVIDRMEIALETAANNSGCDFCEKQWNDCKLQPNNEEFVCDYRIADEWLY